MVSKTDVCVLGNPFGIKIYTDGVMIVGLDSVTTENGKVSPGSDAGLKEGDLIISINGTKVYSNEDVAGIIEASKGKELTLKIISDEFITLNLNSPIDPCVITLVGKEGFLYLVLPVRINA